MKGEREGEREEKGKEGEIKIYIPV